jgi:hypothetical protein
MNPFGNQHGNIFWIFKSKTNPSNTGINGFYWQKLKKVRLIYPLHPLIFGQKFSEDEIERGFKSQMLKQIRQARFHVTFDN